MVQGFFAGAMEESKEAVSLSAASRSCFTRVQAHLRLVRPSDTRRPQCVGEFETCNFSGESDLTASKKPFC